jgi:hypothetical protein
MEEEDCLVEVEPTIEPPPTTPAQRRFKVGDLVQVFNGQHLMLELEGHSHMLAESLGTTRT